MRVIGKRLTELDEAAWQDIFSPYDEVELDIGTGTGQYVADTGRASPRRLVIGIEPVAETLRKVSQSAGAAPGKGGLPNVVFCRGTAEMLPGPFAGVADYVSINYPWGSLLHIVSKPDIDGLRRIRQTCKAGAVLTVLLNYSVFLDYAYLERLGLGACADIAEDPGLPARYAEAEFEIFERRVFEGDAPVRTRWGRQLVRGASRQTLMLRATAVTEGRPA